MFDSYTCVGHYYRCSSLSCTSCHRVYGEGVNDGDSFFPIGDRTTDTQDGRHLEIFTLVYHIKKQTEET